MTQEQFKNIAHTIPHEPGIYKYYNENDQLLYVGKAKDLAVKVNKARSTGDLLKEAALLKQVAAKDVGFQQKFREFLNEQQRNVNAT